MEDKLHIKRLNSTNCIWKFQMEHWLAAQDLWEFVEGTVNVPRAGTNEFVSYKKKSRKALSSIILAVDEEQLYLITSCKTPEEAWNSLKNHFESNSLANRLFLKKKYLRTMMKEGDDMRNHLKNMKDLANKLAAIGFPVAEDEQVITLISSLPSSYDTLVTALETKWNDDIKLDCVHKALLHEEQKKLEKSKTEESVESDSALVSKSKYEIKCFKCGRKGHKQQFCKGSKGRKHNAKITEEEEEDVSDNENVVFTATSQENDSKLTRWLIDSGASSHMCWNRDLFENFEEVKNPEYVGLGDGSSVSAIGRGNVRLNMIMEDGKSKKSTLANVLCVPDLKCNLFSVGATLLSGKEVQFKDSKCIIRNNSGLMCAFGRKRGKLYELNCTPLINNEHANIMDKQVKENKVDIWHQRLGHLHEKQLREVIKKELGTKCHLKSMEKLTMCESCIQGKMHRKPFQALGEIKSTKRLQLIHSDVCGPMKTESLGGKKYFITFIDDYSRNVAVYFMKKKSEALEKFKIFEKLVCNEIDERIVALRSDNGGEYLSKEFKNFLEEKGIRHEFNGI